MQLAAQDVVNPTRGGRGHRPECLCGVCYRIKGSTTKRRKAHGLTVISGGRLRREKFIQAFADPQSQAFGNATRAALTAGYASSSASTRGRELLQEVEVRESVLASLERHGVTADFLAGKMMEGLEATKVQFFSRHGKVTDRREQPDNLTRVACLELAHRLRGELPKNEPEQQVALILHIGDGPMSEDEWNEMVQRDCPGG